MSYTEFPLDSKYITRMLYAYMFEEIRQNGAATAAYYGLEKLGEEMFHNAPLDYSGHFNEIYFAKAVENFQIFYAGVVTVIFILFPNALFKKQFEAGLAFQATNIEELRFQIIEREMSRMTYKSLLELVTEIKKKTGFEMFGSPLAAQRTARFIEIRNLIVHNRCTINNRYISGSKNRSLKPGMRLNIPNQIRARTWLSIEARKMDARLRDKFDIPEDYLRWRSDKNEDDLNA